MTAGNHIPVRLFDPQRLQKLLEESNLDAIVGHSAINFYYLSGFLSLDYVSDVRSAIFAVIPRDPASPAIATLPNWESVSLVGAPIWIPEKILGGQYYVKDTPELNLEVKPSVWEAFVAAINRRGLATQRVGFELDQMSVQLYNAVRAAFPAMDIVDASGIFRKLHMVKTEEEIRRIRHACEITEQATDEALARLKVGMTEKELATSIASGIVQRGAEVLYVQAATGAAAAGRYLPTDRKINRGDIIRTDVSAVVDGYHSDLGRCYVVGKPTPEQKHTYQVSYQALQAGLAALKPGAKAKDVFNAALAVWHQSGFEHVRRHHVGHGLGLEPHEPPGLKPDNETIIEPGMVIAIEVPYYVYGFGGFAPEDVVVVRETGNVQFSHAPAELCSVGQ